MPFCQQIQKLQHGDHACLIFDSLEERMAALVPFIQRGVELRERCLCIVDGTDKVDIAGALARIGLDVPGLERSGIVAFQSRQETYLSDGEFVPLRMLEFLQKMEEDATQDGFTGFRTTGDMTWALGSEPGCDRLFEYEALLNEFSAGSRSIGLCQYHHGSFPPPMMERVLQTHPITIFEGRLAANALYEAPGSTSAEADRLESKLGVLRRVHEAEERAAESEMRAHESELRFAQMVDAVPDWGVFWLDADGRVTNWNSGAERITGFSEEDVLGLNVTEIPVGWEWGNDGPGGSQRGPDRIVREGWRRRKDGSRYWATDALATLRDEDGKVVGYSMATRDLTARRRSATLLSVQKRLVELVVGGASLPDVLRHLAGAVETLSDGTVRAAVQVLDAEGKLGKGVSRSFPDSFLRAIVGLRPSTDSLTCCAAAATGDTVIAPDFASVPGWNAFRYLVDDLGFAGGWSMPILSRDGKVLGTFDSYFREVRLPTEEEREVVAVLAQTASIAIERAHAVEGLRENRVELKQAKVDAEAASHARSQFLAVVSHELRTPLTGIIGYADLLGSDVWGPTTEDQRIHIVRMKNSAWHLVSIIDQILTYSRVDARKEGLNPLMMDVGRVVEECVALLQPEAYAKGIELIEGAREGSTRIESDPFKIRQIVLNLVGNAVKFTDKGMVEVRVEGREDDVRISVRDTGPGIPQAKLDEIFEAFVQGDQSSTRVKGGIGLGLAVSKTLADLLGGEVAVASAPGIGSTFHLTIPRRINPIVSDGEWVG